MCHLPSSIQSNRHISELKCLLLALSIGKKISIHVKCWGTELQGTYLPEGEIPLDKVPF